jgi:hypothetical protein
VLHLDAGVHLQEIEIPVGHVQEFDGPYIVITHRRCSVHGRLPEPGAGPGRDERRGRLLDQLLVATLDGAVAVPQVDHVAEAVPHDLDLDVPGMLEVLLDIDVRYAERRQRLRLRREEGVDEGAGL